MGLFTDSFLLEIACLVPLLIFILYKYITKNYNYWKYQRIPYKEPIFPFGSLKELFLRKLDPSNAYNNVYNEFPRERFFGLIEYGKPTLVVRDPELTKKILVKDFQYFIDRSPLVPLPKTSLSRNLALLGGQEWREMRHKLTPTFTSGKIKMMYVLMDKISEKFTDYLIKNNNEGKPMDIKNALSRFTMDVIASCAFGLDTSSLEGNTEFLDKLSGVLSMSSPSFLMQMCVVFLPFWLLKLLTRSRRKDIQIFLVKIVKDNVEYRQKNNVTRNDFLDLLINIKQNKTIDEKDLNEFNSENASALTIEQMTAQALVFFIAGFETASSLMTFCLFELSRHQDIQHKLFEEIEKSVVKNYGKITYQLLMDIPYLDQVINETLRLYGATGILTRTCTQRYQVPESHLVLEKGQKVIIPIYAFHHDPQYYPDPYHFDPDRFNAENSKTRHPFVFLPFGEGPRNCIGMRFGLLQTKLGLATVILNFHTYVAPNQEIPIRFNPAATITTPINPIQLILNHRKRSDH